MADRNGSKAKTPSPSDIAYQARRKAGKRDEINKAKAHARHNKRMGLDPKYAKNLTTPGLKPHPIRGNGEKARCPLLLRPLMPLAQAQRILAELPQKSSVSLS